MGERRVERDLVALDGCHARRLERLVAVHADADDHARLQPRTAAQQHRGRARWGGRRHRGPGDAEGPHCLLVVEAGIDAVAGLHVELHEVDVDAHLAERVAGVVGELAAKQNVDAVLARVGAEGQGHPPARV